MGLVDRDDGWRMPDWLWQRIEPLLPERPAHPLGCHNPRVPDRDAMEAILLVLRTGMQWNALNATGICSSSSAHRRFQEWERAGLFRELWRQALLAYDETIGIEWEWLALDGAMTKAPLGRAKTGPNPTDRAKKGEREPPLRGQGDPGRDRARRRQPERPQARPRHARLDPDRPARAHPRTAAGPLPRQGLRQQRGARTAGRVRLHRPHPLPRRRSQSAQTGGRLPRPPLARRTHPLLAQPLPGDPDPLVEET